MNQPVYLLTYHGTLICRRIADGAFINCGLGEIGPNIEPVACHLQAGHFLAFDEWGMVSTFSSNQYLVRSCANSNTVSLERASRFLRAWPTGQVDCSTLR